MTPTISKQPLRPGMRLPLERCPKCQGMRIATGFSGPHSPHFVRTEGTPRLVDCKNEEIK